MTSKGDENTVLPEPSCSNEIAVAFLLTDWWYEHGYEEFFYSVLVGQCYLT